MEIFEILLALALWLIFAFLGWRKRAARSASTPAAPGPPVVDEPPSSEPAPDEGEPRGLAQELRELVRQIREGMEPSEPPPAPARPVMESEPAVAPVRREPPSRPAVPPGPLPRLPTALSTRPARSPLVGDLLRDLRSGRQSLARAVLLGEILGPPVALRGEGRRDRSAGGV